MSTVKIYQLKNDGSQAVLVTCRLINNEVILEGDNIFSNNIQKEGIFDYSNNRQKIYPKDGLRFLEQLKYNFKSGYLMATDIEND